MQPDAEPSTVGGWPGPVRNVAWLANDSLVLVVCSDVSGVRVVDTRTWQVVHTLQTAEPVTDVQACDGRLITASGKHVQLWDAASFAPLADFTLDYPAYTAAVCPAKACSPVSHSLRSRSLPKRQGRFVAGGPDMWPRLFDLATGAELECNKGHHGPVHSVRFHPSGESYASGSEDGTIRLWSSTTAAEAAAAAA
jgi:serine-threonine kinase receptor-associated protein